MSESSEETKSAQGNMTTVDVVIVGGSFAGLQAAMVLGRQLFTVVIFDTGLPRNRYAKAMHNVFALDGHKVSEALATMRTQTLAYSTVSLRNAKVTEVRNMNQEAASGVGGDSVFQVHARTIDDTKDDEIVSCRRVILAYGVNDNLPNVPGIWDFWSVGIAHCPHCHGYEVHGKKIGVLKNCPMQGVLMQIAMVKELTSQQVTLFTNGIPLKDEEKKMLSVDVRLVESPISEIVGDKSTRNISQIDLADGTSVTLDCVFVFSATEPAGDLHIQLGLKSESGHAGPFISSDAQRMTNVKGVYVAGDLGNALHQINFALSTGSMSGLQCHLSLMMANLAATQRAKASASSL